MMSHDIPSLRQLRVFESAARLESVSAATREVNLSQPGVTQAIRALEERLDARLFERRRCGSYVTELGTILLPRVRRFWEQLRAGLVELGSDSSAVRQGMDASINRMTRPQLRRVA